MIFQANLRKVGVWLALVLLATLLVTGTASAEGEVPPAEEEPAAEATSSDAAEPLAIVDIATPASGEPAAAPAIAAEAVLIPSSDESAPLAELAAETQETVTVLADASGEPLHLASLESAKTLTAADPYFSVGMATFHFSETAGYCAANFPGDPNCHDGLTNAIQEAINYIQTNGTVPTDRKIYVESGTYNGEVVIDGTLTVLNQLGGLVWDEAGATAPTINNTIFVHDVDFGFTLGGFTIRANNVLAAVRFDNLLGTLTLKDLDIENTGGPGLSDNSHTGAVAMTNVKINNNHSNGAIIQNKAGIFNVTITNSSFDHNNQNSTNPEFGLWVDTRGRVTLNGVSAQDNNGFGAKIQSERGVIIKNSVFSLNYADLDDATRHGLLISGQFTANAVRLDTVQANHNENSGISIDTLGGVSLNNVTANDNGIRGVEVVNSSAAAVNSSSFNDNGNIGLDVTSNGAIQASVIEASGNTGDGAQLDNNILSSGSCTTSAIVKVAGLTPNYFNNNSSSGLRIHSCGSVTVTNVYAKGNLGGVNIENNNTKSIGSVTVNATYVPPTGTWMNYTGYSTGGRGLKIESNGVVSVDRLISEYNSEEGIYITNSTATSLKSVMIKNTVASNNTGNGISVISLGAITLTNVQSYENTLQGANLNNGSGLGSISVVNTISARYDQNQAYGLFVVSNGAITIRNVNADNNRQGSYVDNQSPFLTPVLISGSSFSDSALSGGVYIASNGTVTLQNVTADDNASYGIFIGTDQFDGIYVKSASLANVQANGNLGGSGIRIYAMGAITLNSIKANGNSVYGLFMDNCKEDSVEHTCAYLGNINLQGNDNSFSGNGPYGLYTITRGSVSMSNIIVDDNDSIGVWINANRVNAIGTVKLSASAGSFNSITGNGSTGLVIEARNNITILGTNVVGNGKGASLFNSDATTAKPVLVSASTFNNNQDDGLTISSDGLVILKDVDAIGNSRYNTAIASGRTVHERVPETPYMWADGMFESWWFTGSGTVTIQLRSSEFAPMVYLYNAAGDLLAFDENSGSGTDALITSFSLPSAGDYRIEVASQDNGYGFYDLALDSDIGTVTHNYSDIYGAWVYNSYGNADVFVLPSGSSGNDFSDNNRYGLWVTSKGNVTVNTAAVHSNGNIGARLENTADPIKNMTLVNVQANNNQGQGVYALTYGAINWNGGGANANSSYGATASNKSSPSAKPITISNTSFNYNNGTSGLKVDSLGNITLTNVSATNNFGYGVQADNCQYSGGCTGSGGITVKGKFEGNGFDWNGNHGFYFDTAGAFKWLSTGADHNTGGGLRYMDSSGFAASVTISGTSKEPVSFSNNQGGSGVFIRSSGAISVTYATASNNNALGMYLSNADALTPQAVKLMYITANGSTTSDGLSIHASGPTLISNAIADGNSEWGLVFTNYTFTGQVAVINASRFNSNTDGGMQVNNSGDITLNGITANGNSGTNAILNPDDNIVTILSTLGENSFNGSTFGKGLEIGISSVVSLSKVSAQMNADKGINIINATTLVASLLKVYLNGATGMEATLTGNVTINASQFLSNDSQGLGNADGLWLDVTAGTSVVKITNSSAIGNSNAGISVDSGTTLILTGTFYYGNDSNNSGNPDIEYRP